MLYLSTGYTRAQNHAHYIAPYASSVLHTAQNARRTLGTNAPAPYAHSVQLVEPYAVSVPDIP
eukprot:3941804-Rhodomonas_salina.2